MAEKAVEEKKTSTISIKVVSAKNLRGTKGENLTSFTKVEFGKPLGESGKCEAGAEATTKYNYTANIEINPEDPLSVDELSYKLVVFTIVEVLPKEKRAKEEKTNQVGQCIMDLFPILKGESKFTKTLALQSGAEPAAAMGSQPQLLVEVSCSKVIVTPEKLEQSNYLTINFDSVYSLPDSWQPNNNPTHSYHATLSVPLSETVDVTAAAGAGTLRPPQDKNNDPLKGTAKVIPRRYAAAGNMSGALAAIPDCLVESYKYEEEDYDLTSQDYRSFREEAENEKPRITWNTQREIFMTPAATDVLQDRIAKCRTWPLEVYRTNIANVTKKGKEEDLNVSFHGIAWINLSPLLYPGVTRVKGAALLQPYVESEVAERNKKIARSSTVSGDDLIQKDGASGALQRTGSGGSRRGVSSAKKIKHTGFKSSVERIKSPMEPHHPPSGVHSSSTPHTQGTLSRGATMSGMPHISPPAHHPPRRNNSIITESKKALKDMTDTLDVAEAKNNDANVYLEARSYIVIEIKLDKPLVPKRKPEDLAAKVAEFIPARDPMAKKSCGADEAVEEYHKRIGEVANLILNEYRQKFGLSDAIVSNDEMVRQKKELIYDLNAQGKYFTFKEQLKQVVVKIVREKFFKTSAFQSEEELHSFLSELYVFLVEEMNRGVSKVFTLQDTTPQPPSVLSEENLVHFAREAELNQNYELAARYYQERLAMNNANEEAWFAYGCFSLLIRNVSKAGECFKECLAINQQHINGLILYGVVCMLEERFDVAETFFEDATCVNPQSYQAWTALGLFYDSMDNDIGAEMAFIEANKCFDSKTSVFLTCAEEFLKLHVYNLVEMALSHELLTTPKTLSQKYYMLLAQLNMAKGDLCTAEINVRQATTIDHTNPEAWALLGHVTYLGSNIKSARDNYERAMSYQTLPNNCHAIRLRLASIYVQLQEFQLAKETFLLACRDTPSCLTWLGVGISCYRLEELNEAEQALSEANILNNIDPEVWGYLSLVCLKTNRKLEAEQSYKYALRVGLQDPDLLTEIKSVQQTVGFGDASF